MSPCKQEVVSDGGLVREIDLHAVMIGSLFDLLAEMKLLNQEHLDPEVKTLVCPNKSDFVPGTLHSRPNSAAGLVQRIPQSRQNCIALVS